MMSVYECIHVFIVCMYVRESKYRVSMKVNSTESSFIYIIHIVNTIRTKLILLVAAVLRTRVNQISDQ